MGNRSPWSTQEKRRLLHLLRRKATSEECGRAFPQRTATAVAIERAILKKESWIWGAEHTRERRQLLQSWIKSYEPKRVFEGFAGRGESTLQYAQGADTVLAAEVERSLFKDAKKRLRNHKNVFLVNRCAELLLFSACGQGFEFDWVDLDPYGSVGHLVPLAVRLVPRGYVCFTLTELHMFRFRRRLAVMCKYLLPSDIFCRPSYVQLGFLLGWIIFDSTRYTFWRGRKLIAQPKRVIPIEIVGYGGLESRIARVLFRIEPAQDVRELYNHLFRKLKLFKNGGGLPYFDMRALMTGGSLQP